MLRCHADGLYSVLRKCPCWFFKLQKYTTSCSEISSNTLCSSRRESRGALAGSPCRREEELQNHALLPAVVHGGPRENSCCAIGGEVERSAGHRQGEMRGVSCGCGRGRAAARGIPGGRGGLKVTPSHTLNLEKQH